MDWDVEEGKIWVTDKLRQLVAGLNRVEAYDWEDEEQDGDSLVLQIWCASELKQLRISRRTLKYLARSQPLQSDLAAQLGQVLVTIR